MKKVLVVRGSCIGDTLFVQEMIKLFSKSENIQFDVLTYYEKLKFLYQGAVKDCNIYCAKLTERESEHEINGSSKIMAILKQLKLNNYCSVIVADYQSRRLLKMIYNIMGFNNIYTWSIHYSKNQKVHRDKRLGTKVFEKLSELKGVKIVEFYPQKHISLNLYNLFNSAFGNDNLEFPESHTRAMIPLSSMFNASDGIVVNITGKPHDNRAFSEHTYQSLLSSLLLMKTRVAIVVDDKNKQDVISFIERNKYTNKIDVIQGDLEHDVLHKLLNYKYFVGVDGGLSHCAAALGLYLISVYSVDMYSLWRPWTDRNISIIIKNASEVTSEQILEKYKQISSCSTI
ncbi:MAG: glycosyltransferase family 9 protein [Burkholderiales bacterium]|nr:glycosyltransferase family 9 protein [Burkholderiales bacterium]